VALRLTGFPSPLLLGYVEDDSLSTLEYDLNYLAKQRGFMKSTKWSFGTFGMVELACVLEGEGGDPGYGTGAALDSAA